LPGVILFLLMAFRPAYTEEKACFTQLSGDSRHREVSLIQEERVNLPLPFPRIWKKTLEKGVKIGIKRNRGKKPWLAFKPC
jgi:hypothetical protein